MDYRNKKEFEESVREQTIHAIGQAVAVALAIILCAIVTALTGCASAKKATQASTNTTTITAKSDSTATRKDSAHILTTWQTVQADTTYAQTWHALEFAPTGGTLTIDTAGTVHATNVTAYRTHAKTKRAAKEVTYKTADSTAVAEHGISAHTSRDTAYAEASTTNTTAAPCTRRHVTWASALMALLIAAMSAAVGAWAVWKRKYEK